MVYRTPQWRDDNLQMLSPYITDHRLDNRVDKMIEKGLINELAAFHTAYNSPLLSQSIADNHGDYTRGIFQCIGFKEFHSYLTMSATDQVSAAGKKLLADGKKYHSIKNKLFNGNI